MSPFLSLSLARLGRFRLTLQTTSETQLSDSQPTVALYFSSIAKPSDLLMQQHVIEWLGSLLRTYLTNVCRGLLTPSNTKWPKCPQVRPKPRNPRRLGLRQPMPKEIPLTRTTTITNSLVSSSPTAHKNSN